MTTTTDPIKADPKKVEAFLANEDHIRKVELMQTLVARNQAMVRDIIKQEKSKQNPDAKKIGKLREEIDRLYSLRDGYEKDKIDETLATLKAYQLNIE
jgi:hypothetical protein